MDNVMEEYHAIFAERMIQHPAVQLSVIATIRHSSRRRRRKIAGIKNPLSRVFLQSDNKQAIKPVC
jgi:hypothetical protein